MDPNVDAGFIQRAVEASDLAALRVALYQATGDPELARFGPVATLDDAERGQLQDRAAHLLETQEPLDGNERDEERQEDVEDMEVAMARKRSS